MVRCPTQREPDWWEPGVFKQFAWLEVGSVKAASPRPAHQRVTQPVSPLAVKKY